MIVLYSTGCPKCRILEAKLAKIKEPYSVIEDVDTMVSLGITEAPMLEVEGRLLGFGEAVKWINAEVADYDCPTCKL